jgi:hypothetical protein
MNPNYIREIPAVNGHIHTPYSFSAFADPEQAFRMAVNEQVIALGINDFNTFAGYEEFAELSRRYGVYPLFNVEFMGLLEKEQQKGIRINDPANPGRIYFSGKGLDYPVQLSGRALAIFNETFTESNRQTRLMLQKASQFLQTIDADMVLDYQETVSRYTRGMLRERHIARAIREAVFNRFQEDEKRIEILKLLFGGKEVKPAITDNAGIDNEIRSHILKAGGPAFVPEDPKAFLPLEEILDIIGNGGGIPCYPVLLDDSKGNYTEFEADAEALWRRLMSMNIFSLELIPGRNDISHLRAFVEFFDRKGFIITFGTEHNTPEMIPLKVCTRGNIPLDIYLRKVNFNGVCMIAAHQHLRAKGEKGISGDDAVSTSRRNELIDLGSNVIREFCESMKTESEAI